MPASRSIFTERATDVSVNLLIVENYYFALNRLDLDGILVLRRSRSIDCRLRVRRGKPRAQSVGTGDSLHSVSPLFIPHVTISRTRGEYLAQGAASLRVHAPPALTSGSAHAIPRFFLLPETRSGRPHPGTPALRRWRPRDLGLPHLRPERKFPSQSRQSRGLELT